MPAGWRDLPGGRRAARGAARRLGAPVVAEVFRPSFLDRRGGREKPSMKVPPAGAAGLESRPYGDLDSSGLSPAMTSSAEPDLFIYLDGELLATVTLDAVQDDYPWYSGALAEGPAMPRWRDFVDRYAEADLDFSYHPHHPDEGPYEETDLAGYVKALRELLDARVRGAPPPDGSGEDPWVEPWLGEPIERLEQYIDFLDWRRWRVVSASGAIVEGVSSPPDLRVESGRFTFRP